MSHTQVRNKAFSLIFFFFFSKEPTECLVGNLCFLPHAFVDDPMKQQLRFRPEIKIVPDFDVVVPLEVLKIHEPSRAIITQFG